GGLLLLPLQRCGPSDSTVTVNYSFRNGTASNGVDFAGTNGTVVFAPNEVNKTIRVTTLGDYWIEPEETFSVTLDAPSAAVLGRLSTDGSRDTNFSPGISVYEVHCIVPLLAGDFLVGGSGLRVGGNRGIALVHSDGSPDPHFVGTVDNDGDEDVHAIALDGSG